MKKNWKQILLVVLCIGLVFALCACSSQEDNGQVIVKTREEIAIAIPGYVCIAKQCMRELNGVNTVATCYTYYSTDDMGLYDLIVYHDGYASGASFTPRLNLDGTIKKYVP